MTLNSREAQSPTFAFNGYREKVAIEVSDLVDRLFIPPAMERHVNGLSALLQDGLTLSALDNRRFVPPIESALDREDNIDKIFETFKISMTLCNSLKSLGFRSATLLTFLDQSKVKADSEELDRLNACISALNASPLEPLYSLCRLAGLKKTKTPRFFEVLDLATELKPVDCVPVNSKFRLISYATYQAKNHFGKQFGSRGIEHHVEQPRPEAFIVNPQILFVPYTDPMPTYQPFLVHSPTSVLDAIFTEMFPMTSSNSSSSNSLNEGFESWANLEELESNDATSGTFCPFLDCRGSLRFFNQTLEDHLYNHHGGYDIERKAKIVYPPDEEINEDESFFNNYLMIGQVEHYVEFALFSPEYFWWGPKVFIQDNIAFFVVVFKVDDALVQSRHGGNRTDPRLAFFVQAHLTDEEASNYAYDIQVCDYNRNSRRFKGKVFGLLKRNGELPFRQDATTSREMVYKMVYYHRSHLEKYVNKSNKIRFNLGLYRYVD